MGLQSQFNSLIGSVSGAISSVSENLQVDETKMKETEYRLERYKTLREKQKASMEKQHAIYLESKYRQMKAQSKIDEFNKSKEKTDGKK